MSTIDPSLVVSIVAFFTAHFLTFLLKSMTEAVEMVIVVFIDFKN